MAYICPRCGSESIQSFRMAYTSGVSTGRSSGSGTAYVNGEWAVVNTSGSTRSVSELARFAAPPKRMRTEGTAFFVVSIIFLIFSVLVCFFMIGADIDSYNRLTDLVIFMTMSYVFLTIITLLLFILMIVKIVKNKRFFVKNTVLFAISTICLIVCRQCDLNLAHSLQSSAQFELSNKGLLVLFALVFWALIILTYISWNRMTKSSAKADKYNANEYPVLLNNWEHSYLCHKCGNTFYI